MLSDINVEAGEAMADKLRSAGHDARFLRADATVEEEVAALVSKTVEVFGGLHLAANIVGDAHPEAAGPEFHQKSLNGWEHRSEERRVGKEGVSPGRSRWSPYH